MVGKILKVCFEVRCQSCGVTFHIILASLRGVSDPVYCPCCSGTSLQKVREKILSSMLDLDDGGNGEEKGT